MRRRVSDCGGIVAPMATIDPHTEKPYPLESRRHHAFRQALDADWLYAPGMTQCVICIRVPVAPGSPEPVCTVCAEVRREGHLPGEAECPCRECLPVLPPPRIKAENPPRRSRKQG